MIPEDKVREIRERNDVKALVGEYVDLKRIGASFRGLCPFHSEKTPSFYVHPARQFYHCFGCHASGDVISFLMQLEGRSFPEAVRTLADRAGIELPVLDAEDDAEHRRQRERTERLAALMDAATGFYVRQLAEHPLGDMARAELERRGIGPEATERFRLGYAPHGWDALVRFLADGGWSPADAEAVGLIVPRRSGDGFYDRFRHRLQFPIADAHGRVVAFSGRILDPPPGADTDREPGAKYVNSPEGPLYRKGEVLYGLHEGRVQIRREGWAVVCEGNFDLVALHQAGVANSVAPMGTALTEKHAKLLRRYTEQVVLLFDGDAAGSKAVRAAFPVLAREALTVRVASLPRGADPDSYVREHGADALIERVQGAPGIVEHLIDEAAASSLGDAAATGRAIEELGPVIATVGSPVEIQLYVERVARKFGLTDVQAVKRQLRRGVRAARGGRRDPEPRPSADAPRGDPPGDLPALQCELVGVFFDVPDLFASESAKEVEELLTSPDLRAIFQTTSRMVESRGRVDAPALLTELSGNPAAPWLEERLAVQKYDGGGAQRALRDGVPRLARQNIELELPRLQQRILEARRLGDEERATKLTQEHVALFRSAKRLMQGIKR